MTTKKKDVKEKNRLKWAVVTPQLKTMRVALDEAAELRCSSLMMVTTFSAGGY